jgi:hypothetical protein
LKFKALLNIVLKSISMTKIFVKFLLSLLGAGWYLFLFYSFQIGINVLLFTLTAIGVAFWQFPEARQRKEAKLLAATTIISAILVVIQHTLLARIAHHISLLVFIGFIQAPVIRFLFFGLHLGVISLLVSPLKLVKDALEEASSSFSFNHIGRWVPYVAMPCMLVIVFGAIYYSANPKFAQAIDFLTPSLDFIHFNLINTTIGLMGFCIFAAFIGEAPFITSYEKMERAMANKLLRRKGDTQKSSVLFRILSLKREYWAGIATLVALNFLLFFANVADLRYVWINYGQASPQELSQYVHEGTYLLICALLLAMGVLLWYFRGNLNFYPDNGLMKQLAYIWLAQNMMLAISVGLRNWQYVQQYGLAYKRLGVFWFLLLVLYGLFSLYQKIDHRRTLFFLLRRNSLMLFCSLLLVSSINWDRAITHYNIHADTSNDIDAHFLLHKLSSDNLSILWRYEDKIVKQSKMTASAFNQNLKEKQQQFDKQMEQRDWRGWNLVDARNERLQ